MITKQEFREYMGKFGISQNKMARELGFQKGNFSRMVNQKRKLSRITEYFIRSYFANRQALIQDKRYNKKSK